MAAPIASGGLTIGNTPALDEFIRTVRKVVERCLSPESTARLAGQALRPVLAEPDLLTPAQCEGDPHRYRQHVLHAEPDGSFSVVALVWLPGQLTPIHDHVSWCVTGVHRGQESEWRYRLLPGGGDQAPRLAVTEYVVNPVGSIAAFAPPGDIHRVCNTGSDKAISIHLYGADISRLGSSIRRLYPAPADEA